MAGVQVPIDFEGRFNQLLDSFDETLKKVNKKTSETGDSMKFLETAAKAFVAAFAVDKIVSGLQNIIKQSSDADESVLRLSNGLRATGDYSENNVRQFRALAEELSKTSRYDDDVIISQVALAKQFGTTNTEAAKLIRAAVDLSAVTGDDLNTSVRNLGMTLDGTAGRLAQQFPILQSLTAEQLRAGKGVEVLGAQYAGAAERGLNTFAGQQAQVTKSFDDLLKVTGSSITQNEAVIQSLKTVAEIFNALQDVVRANKDTLTDFVTGGVLFLVNSLNGLVIAAGALDRFFSILFNQVKALLGLLDALADAAGGRVLTAFEKFKDTIEGYKEGNAAIGQSALQYSKLSDKLADTSVKIEMAAQSTQKIAKATKDVADGFDDAGKKANRFAAEQFRQFEELRKSLQDVGATELDTLTNQYKRQIKIISDAKNSAFGNRVNEADVLGKLELKYVREAGELRKKQFQELQGQLKEIYSDPLSSLNDPSKTPIGGSVGLSADAQKQGAGVLGIVKSVLSGADGARELLGSAVSAVGTALFGPLGSLFGDLAKILSQGPEQVKAMIEQFADALPDLIANIVEAIPVVIQTIAEKLPDIIEKLFDKLPEIVDKLADSMPRVAVALAAEMPRVIVALIAGTFEFNKHILEGAFNFVGKILEGAVQFVGKVLEGAAKFAEQVAKGAASGIGNVLNLGGDNFFSGGEGLIDDSVPGLGFLKGQQQAQSAAPPMTVNVQIDRKNLAKALVDLDRFGYRTSV